MDIDKIVDLAKRRGFFWQSSGLYGGIAGFYDYGHLGAALKRKWEGIWRSFFLGMDDYFYEIQPSQVMPEGVFKASGHLQSFVDPVVRCARCRTVYRADHILEDFLKENFEGLSPKAMSELIKKHKIKCSKCKGQLEEVGVLNMMFPLKAGTGEGSMAYLAPETAQGAYLSFKQEFETLRRRLPLGLAVIGKAFRNEISPRNVLIRMREFTQAELQIFFDPREIGKHPKFKEVANYKLRLLPVKLKRMAEMKCREAVAKLRLPEFYVYYMAKIQQFYLDVLKLPRDRIRFRQLSDEEKAFYNKYHWDVEARLESLGGFKEIAGLHFRTAHDLEGHQRESGESQEVNIEGRKFIPNVLELSFGVDRNIYTLLELAYTEEKGRTVLKFPRLVSPYDAGIFPLVNRDGLQEKARKVQELLRKQGFQVFYDESGSIGRRYRRVDEIGVAVGITIDYDSLKKNDVTLRDRDSMKQVRVKIKELSEKLRLFLEGERLGKLGKPLK